MFPRTSFVRKIGGYSKQGRGVENQIVVDSVNYFKY